MPEDKLTPLEQRALRYQPIVAEHDPACTCPPCREIALLITVPLNN